MPTYQYQCTQCGDAFERVQKFTDPAIETCPGCQGKVRKIYSAVGIVFKGSGFYATDSRSSSSSATLSASGGSDKGTTPAPSSAPTTPPSSPAS